MKLKIEKICDYFVEAIILDFAFKMRGCFDITSFDRNKGIDIGDVFVYNRLTDEYQKEK